MTAGAVTSRSRLLLAGLVITHLVAISGQVDAGGSTLLERMLLGALAPVEGMASGAVGGLRGAWRRYVALREVREENRRLAERVEVLELLLQQKQDRVREADRLRGLLGLREAHALETVAAAVVARQGQPWFRSVLVDRGRDSGIVLDAAAITPQGVAGRVVAVGPAAARVQLLLDRECAVGVLVERSRVTGVVQGQVGIGETGTGELLMKYVPALADVTVGDRVLSSGLDGIYPKGLLVGEVVSVGRPAGLFRDVIVAPAVAFDRVEELLLVKPSGRSLALDKGVR
ncbi:MAG: rod shape-determining protein MreC [Vicinamibacteria bacterium]